MVSRTRLLLSVALAGALGLGSQSAYGWGADGHKMIGDLGVKSLPREVPYFLRMKRAVREAGYLAPEPDRERNAGKTRDAEHDPGHFVDVSDDATILGGPALNALPQTREEYDTALRAVGSTQYKAGYLPYEIVDGYQLLVKDFAYWRVFVVGEKRAHTKAQRKSYKQHRIDREWLILHNIGMWAHFVGDGSQPLHASVHYNGWGEFPNPENFTQAHIHWPFESAYVRANVSEAAVKAAMPAYRDCSCGIEARTSAYLAATASQAVPLYRLEKAGAFAQPTPEGKAFATKQVALGAAELRDMIVDAWHASDSGLVGYPGVKASDIESGAADLTRALQE